MYEKEKKKNQTNIRGVVFFVNKLGSRLKEQSYSDGSITTYGTYIYGIGLALT